MRDSSSPAAPQNDNAEGFFRSLFSPARPAGPLKVAERGEKFLLDQLGRQTDLRSCQHLGHRTAFLGVLGELRKGRGVDAGYLRFRVELNPGDAETLSDFLQVHRGRGVDARGRKAALAQSGGQGHGKAAGVRRGNQFLGIGARAALKP